MKNFSPCLDCPNGQKLKIHTGNLAQHPSMQCTDYFVVQLLLKVPYYHNNFFPFSLGFFSLDLTKVQKVQGQSQQICNISKQSLQKYVVCINTISITTTFKIGKVTDQQSNQRFRSSIILEQIQLIFCSFRIKIGLTHQNRVALTTGTG